MQKTDILNYRKIINKNKFNIHKRNCIHCSKEITLLFKKTADGFIINWYNFKIHSFKSKYIYFCEECKELI